MKTIYQKMSKKERKEIKKEYKNTETGKKVLKKFTISKIMFTLSYLFSIYLILDTYHNKRSNIYYFYAGSIIIVIIFFMILYRNNYQKILNSYIVKKNKSKNKK